MRPVSEASPFAAATARRRVGPPGRAARLAGCEAVLVVLADWLLWDHRIGLALPLFAAAAAFAGLAGRASARRPRGLTRGRLAAAIAILTAGLLPMVEDLSLLSLAFGVAGTAVAVEVGASGTAGPWSLRLWRAAARLAGAGGLFRHDAALARKIARRSRDTGLPRRATLLAWVVPAALLAAFLSLFAAANPIIAGWLADLPQPSWPTLASLMRVAFWMSVLAVTWPLVRARGSRPGIVPGLGSAARPQPPPAPAGHLAAALLAPAAIRRTLVACNLLFAVQLALDGAYLWGGMALPHGMGYAAYAHRGAYPLVATALLSAAFVLAARRPAAGGSDGSSRRLQLLVLAFTGQNVLLVASSMRRLALYVDAYSLTELRVAAFVWMLLVAIGLGLIMLQAALGRDNAWLVTRAAASTAAVLYACCFIDVPGTVASYDVDHCAAALGTGPALDLEALQNLGPDALPALDRYLGGPVPDTIRDTLVERRGLWAAQALAQAGDWRAWSLRAWRLERYVDRIGAAGEAAPESHGPAAPSPDAP